MCTLMQILNRRLLSNPGCSLSLFLQFLEALIGQYPQIEVSIRTSARHLQAVQEVFVHAVKVVLYPKPPLLDAATGRLTTPCVKALLRIFLMCDHDGVSAVVALPLDSTHPKLLHHRTEAMRLAL